MKYLAALLACVLLVIAPTVACAEELRPVKLQLKWRHQFQFAGYYAARAQGFYRRAGFEVEIAPATPGTNAIDEVVAGRAAFGVASSELALRYAQGTPVVAVAVVFQHSPLTLFVRTDRGIATVHDLVGHRVAVSSSEAEMVAYLRREHVPFDRLVLTEHDFSVDSLVAGKVDALAGYETDESYFLRNAPGTYAQLRPRSSGIDFYGDTLFTSQKLASESPERVEAFRAATLQGWVYALAHIPEMAALIHEQYAPDLPEEKLRFEAERMGPLVRDDLVEVGHMYAGRWQHIVDVYRELGLIDANAPVDVERLMVQPAKARDYRWVRWWVPISLVVLGFVALLARRFYVMSRGLREKLTENVRLQEELRRLATTDPLTGLANRRHFDGVFAREIARARREKAPVAVLFIDVDHFKSYNDHYGHAAGDECLVALAKVLTTSVLRPTDVAARYGGEEFVVLLPNTDAAGAGAVAKRVLDSLGDLAIPHIGSDLMRVSASIGVAAGVPEQTEDKATLLERADRAVYAAKDTGRNRVVSAPAAPS